MPEQRRQRRVTASHTIARTAFRLTGVFVAVALAWSVVVMTAGGSWWGPLHSFLAGGVLLAISGATQMFTITWAAAVPPTAVVAALQRWSIAGGMALVLVGVSNDLRWLTVTGAAGATLGLALLAGSLLTSIRRSLLRRFDLSARFYMVALASGTLGITLGAVMDWGVSGETFLRLRPVHVHLNLVGLIGLTIIGTLPTILATFSHHRAVSGREALWAWWACLAAVLLFTLGIFVPGWPVGTGMVVVAAAALTVLAGVLLRLGKRGLKGGLPYLMVTAGTLWLVTWAVADAAQILVGSAPAPFSTWTAAAAVAGVGQVLIGSLTYIVPVLAGPPPRLGRNFKRLGEPAYPPLILANASGLALVTGLPGAGVVLVALWVAEFVRRLVMLEWRERQPTPF